MLKNFYKADKKELNTFSQADSNADNIVNILQDQTPYHLEIMCPVGLGQ